MKRQEDEIVSLKGTVAKWRDVAQQQSSQLQELQTMAQGMGQERSVNAATISRLQSELCTCQEQRSAVQEELSQLRSLHDSSAADTQQQLHELREANATMAEERARVASVREATASKLLEVRTRLGLSEAEARHFLQELDLARSKAEELRRERDRMAADQQARSEQARSRSQHCLVLIEDNKRLMGTVAALRSQVARLDAQQLALTAAAGAAAAEAAAVSRQKARREVCARRPEWQGLSPVKAPPSRSAAGAPAATRAAAAVRVVRAPAGPAACAATEEAAGALHQALQLARGREAGEGKVCGESGEDASSLAAAGGDDFSGGAQQAADQQAS